MSKIVRNQVMVAIYSSLFVLLGGSLFVFLHSFLTLNSGEWNIYARAYFILVFVYTWYIFILLFLDDLKKSKYQPYNNETIAIIVPCYNEKPQLLKISLQSVIRAKGNKKILIIDDGSEEVIRKEIKSIVTDLQKQGCQIELHVFEKNRGKRQALYYAVSELIKESQFVVTIDSDTVLDENALVKIVEPLKNLDIGAASGDVRLLNEKQNWLTRMIGSYYWVAMNIGKKAQSSIGMVGCCSGCLAAYKASIMKEVIHEFVVQEFLGRRCTHSEDRHLTNLVLEKGYKVVYIPQAISYTETPATIGGFLRQQLRWQRGFIQESIYTLTYAWKTKKQLFLQVLLWDLTSPFITFGMQVATVVTVFFYTKFFLYLVLPSWIAFILLRNVFVIIYSRERVGGLFIYAVFYQVFMYWLTIYALFTVKNKSWITR